MEYLTGGVPFFLHHLVKTPLRNLNPVSSEAGGEEGEEDSHDQMRLSEDPSGEFEQFLEKLWQSEQVQLLGNRITQYAADYIKVLKEAGHNPRL